MDKSDPFGFDISVSANFHELLFRWNIGDKIVNLRNVAESNRRFALKLGTVGTFLPTTSIASVFTGFTCLSYQWIRSTYLCLAGTIQSHAITSLRGACCGSRVHRSFRQCIEHVPGIFSGRCSTDASNWIVLRANCKFRGYGWGKIVIVIDCGLQDWIVVNVSAKGW